MIRNQSINGSWIGNPPYIYSQIYHFFLKMFDQIIPIFLKEADNNPQVFIPINIPNCLTPATSTSRVANKSKLVFLRVDDNRRSNSVSDVNLMPLSYFFSFLVTIVILCCLH
jgi:hypothetical protein